jgi:nitrite reductase (NADH) small subunit
MEEMFPGPKGSNAAGGGGLAWHVLADWTDLPGDGSGLCREVAGRRVALFRDGERVHAIDDQCPHAGASLGLGIVLAGEVTCPSHAWHFELGSGRNTDGLAACVEVFPVRVRSGRIEVCIEPASTASGPRAAGEPGQS